MIPRYSRKEMAALWAPETRFRIWLEIETHACDAQAALGRIPKSAAQAVRERGAFEVERIEEIERETRHDVIAFLTNLAEHVGPEARFVHQGMTSSDVLDTCLAVQLTRAADLLDSGIGAVMDALERRAREHRLTACIGRSHGIHAEPTTFGLKLAGHYAEFARNRDRLAAARAEVADARRRARVVLQVHAVGPGRQRHVRAIVDDYAGRRGAGAIHRAPHQVQETSVAQIGFPDLHEVDTGVRAIGDHLEKPRQRPGRGIRHGPGKRGPVGHETDQGRRRERNGIAGHACHRERGRNEHRCTSEYPNRAMASTCARVA